MLRHTLSRALCLLCLAAPVLLVAGCKEAEKKAEGKAVDVSKMAVGNPNAGYCPVTGNKIDVAKATADPAVHSIHKDKVYLFCCPGCKPEFEKDPEKYIKTPTAPKTGATPAPAQK